MESNIVQIKKNSWTITVDAETAPLLLELCSKAAVAGPQARLLADLYAQAETAARAIADES